MDQATTVTKIQYLKNILLHSDYEFKNPKTEVIWLDIFMSHSFNNHTLKYYNSTHTTFLNFSKSVFTKISGRLFFQTSELEGATCIVYT